MALRLKWHLHVRVAACFVGFFGGFALYAFFVFGKPQEPILVPLVFFGMIFGGAYLAQLAYGLAFPAACPSCGAPKAVPSLGNPIVYVCRACGTRTNAVQAMLTEAFFAQQPSPTEREKSERGVAWLFLAVGAPALGVAIWLAQDSIQFVRKGVSVEATVTRVRQYETRDAKDRREVHYTASIEYRAPNTPLTIERGWSVTQGSSCWAPCYYEGERLKVIYLPAEPGRAKVHSLMDMFVGPVLVGAIALMLLIVGFMRIRQPPPRPRLEL